MRKAPKSVFASVLLVALMSSQTSLGQDAPEEGSEDAEPEAEAPAPLVSIGHHTVAGEPRYAVRSETDGGTATVLFSAVRPRSDGSTVDIPDRLPVSGARLTSRHGYRVHPVTGRGSRHAGVDLAVAIGTPVVATADGEVTLAGWAGNYGILIVVQHEDAMQTRYGHLSALHVRSGERVTRGQVIGRSGATGRTTGPHVHYEVRIDGVSVNPMPVSE